MLLGYAGGAIAIGLRLLAEQAAPVPSAAAPEVNSPPTVAAETVAPSEPGAEPAPSQPTASATAPTSVEVAPTASRPEPPAPEKAEKKPERAPARVIRLDTTQNDQPFVEADPKPAPGWPYFIAGGAVAAVGGVLLFPCMMSANGHSSDPADDPCRDDAPRILGFTALVASVPLFVLGFVQTSKSKAWKRRNRAPRVVPMIGRDALLLGYTGSF